MRPWNPVIYHFSITLFSTFFILFFKVSLCAGAHLELIRTSTGLIIWSFPLRADFLRLFSVSVSEAAFRRCSMIKFAKLYKIHRKTPVTESLFDAIFSSYWKTKSRSKTQLCKQISRYEKSSSLLKMSKLWIFNFVISFKPSLTLFSWDIHQFVFVLEFTCAIYHFQSKLAFIIDYMIILNLFSCGENFNSVCSNRAEISARFTVVKFLPIIVILLLLSLSVRDEISYHGLTTWNFNPGWNCPTDNPSLRWSF